MRGRTANWIGPAAGVAASLSLTACAPVQAPVTPLPQAPRTAEARVSGSTAELLPQRRAAGIADCPTADPSVPARPDGLPDLTVDCLGGDSRVRLAALRGTPMVVNVWAQWCGPCRQEAPHLAALQDQLDDHVRLLGVDFADPRPDVAIEFAQQAGWRYPQVVDPDRTLAGPLRVLGPPLTLFVAADGRVVHRHSGPFTSEAQAFELVRDHLGVTP